MKYGHAVIIEHNQMLGWFFTQILIDTQLMMTDNRKDSNKKATTAFDFNILIRLIQ